MLKLIEWIKDCLPVSRREYLETLAKVTVTLQAITQADEQRSQIQMNLVQNANAMRANKKQDGTKSTVPENDPAYK